MESGAVVDDPLLAGGEEEPRGAAPPRQGRLQVSLEHHPTISFCCRVVVAVVTVVVIVVGVVGVVVAS